ncbi:hypothetical protein [Sphingomonas koreensis]|uniref:hypothetical protein n=1 Tax=Sphingomonas koreensis TaxID=93064 RepID=UPI0013DDEBA9|nr:hypothetical protein [Sphingomonas koreensis]
MALVKAGPATRLVFDHGNGVECWLIDGEYYVYGVTRDPRIAHSEGAANEIASSAGGAA